MPNKEDLEFRGYEKRGSRMCAILIERKFRGAALAFTKACLEARVANLSKGGYPHEETSAALACFPETLAGDTS